jgi:hypothetical protein
VHKVAYLGLGYFSLIEDDWSVILKSMSVSRKVFIPASFTYTRVENLQKPISKSGVKLRRIVEKPLVIEVVHRVAKASDFRVAQGLNDGTARDVHRRQHGGSTPATKKF